jgi:hypothetical protein
MKTQHEFMFGLIALGVVIVVMMAFFTAKQRCGERGGVLVDSATGWVECVERR